MSLHIYTAERQPATRWIDPNMPGRRVHRTRPHVLIRTDCCLRRRHARHCDISVYYDCLRYYCHHGHGCTVEPRGRMRKCPVHGRCRGCAVWRASR